MRSCSWDLHDEISVFIRRERERPELSLPLLHEDRVRRQLPDSQKDGPQQNLTMLASWSWTCSLQKCDRRNFCYLSHPVYGILLWQSQLTYMRHPRDRAPKSNQHSIPSHNSGATLGLTWTGYYPSTVPADPQCTFCYHAVCSVRLSSNEQNLLGSLASHFCLDLALGSTGGRSEDKIKDRWGVLGCLFPTLVAQLGRACHCPLQLLPGGLSCAAPALSWIQLLYVLPLPLHSWGGTYIPGLQVPMSLPLPLYFLSCRLFRWTI